MPARAGLSTEGMVIAALPEQLHRPAAARPENRPSG